MMSEATLTKKDFSSDIDVKWCPGCGDYAILSAVQSTMPTLGIAKEDIVFISGIGCSSRFPHYMDTYGFHTIHGRAPALATGLKMSNPSLSVWVITGDGDGLSIGGNHLIHALKRNVDLNILLFNNNIYGLTKGQVSPTSKAGTVTKSTPLGSVDDGLHPLELAIAAGSTFIARTMDKNPKHMQEVFKQAAAHKGTSFIEILQNCVIFNNKVHDNVTAPTEERKENTQLHLEAGKPMLYGENNEKGIVLNTETLELESVTIGENGITEADILIHKPEEDNKTMAKLISELKTPTAFGVIRSISKPTYEGMVHEQITEYQSLKGQGSIKDLVNSGETWTVS